MLVLATEPEMSMLAVAKLAMVLVLLRLPMVEVVVTLGHGSGTGAAAGWVLGRQACNVGIVWEKEQKRVPEERVKDGGRGCGAE